MSPTQIHLVTAHVPVIGLLFAAATLAVAAATRDRRMLNLGLAFTAVCLVTGAVTYATGPPGYERVRDALDIEALERADRHAVAGRAAFVALVVIAVGCVQAAIRAFAGSPPPPWTSWLLVTALLAAWLLLAWTAHLGGGIRHPDVRASVSTVEAGHSP